MTAAYSGCSPDETNVRVRLVIRRAIRTASAAADAPSYIDALAIGSPKSSEVIVWNSKIACSVPCATSAW